MRTLFHCLGIRSCMRWQLCYRRRVVWLPILWLQDFEDNTSNKRQCWLHSKITPRVVTMLAYACASYAHNPGKDLVFMSVACLTDPRSHTAPVRFRSSVIRSLLWGYFQRHPPQRTDSSNPSNNPHTIPNSIQ